MNVLSVIFPYRLEGVWVFDDAVAGLVREPFISGTDNILDVLTENIPDAARGFKIIFSARPFPGYTARFVWTRAEYGGNWYRWPKREMEGWLCPALLKYFERKQCAHLAGPLNDFTRDTYFAKLVLSVEGRWHKMWQTRALNRPTFGIAPLTFCASALSHHQLYL
jgi:hypothetical protein